MNVQDLPTEPLFNNPKHFILDLRVTIVIVRVVERLKNLTKGQYESAERVLISNTLVMTSSGFESFDQAFNRIQHPTQVDGELV